MQEEQRPEEAPQPGDAPGVIEPVPEQSPATFTCACCGLTYDASSCACCTAAGCFCRNCMGARHGAGRCG